MTFVATAPQFLDPDMPGHPETARRLEAILAHFDGVPALRALHRLAPDRPASDDELLRVHSRRLLLAVGGAQEQAPAWLDPDTYVVAGSERTARLGARLAAQAAERAIEAEEGGLVLVRPPGHHATRDRSMGFCLYNNVAVAAEHVLATGAARRVFVFDHDVHHGNGTQEIFYESGRVLYASFHLQPHYPGTGRVEETGAGAGAGFTVNAPLEAGDGEAEVRSLLSEIFLPRAAAFRPDLILVSAGFDSLDGDPLGGLRLGPRFFGEIVARLRTLTRRVVCVLEGGYQLDRIPLAAEHEARALDGAPYPAAGPERPPACLAELRRRPQRTGGSAVPPAGRAAPA